MLNVGGDDAYVHVQDACSIPYSIPGTRYAVFMYFVPVELRDTRWGDTEAPENSGRTSVVERLDDTKSSVYTLW